MARSLLTHTPVRQRLVLGLGVFAVALVFGLLLYASANPAGASNAPPPVDDGGSVSERPVYQDKEETPTPTSETPTPTPKVYATPEPCLANTADVISAGHYALFDVWWDSDDKDADGVNLTGNDCPPAAVHRQIHHQDGTTTHQTTRIASNIDIAKTIIHVPETTQVEGLAAVVTRYYKR